MHKLMHSLAQQIESVPGGSTALTVLGLAAAGITAVYGWFKSELTECKKDRAELFNRIEKLHDDLASLSMRVGRVERDEK